MYSCFRRNVLTYKGFAIYCIHLSDLDKMIRYNFYIDLFLCDPKS